MEPTGAVQACTGIALPLNIYTVFVLCFSFQTFLYKPLLLLVFSLGLVWAGTRAQSSDRYGSDTLHPGQVLRGSLPLFSPAIRRSHFRRQPVA